MSNNIAKKFYLTEESRVYLSILKNAPIFFRIILFILHQFLLSIIKMTIIKENQLRFKNS